MFKFIKKRRIKKLKRLQSIARGLAYILPFDNDVNRMNIGGKNLYKLIKKINKLYYKIYGDVEDWRDFYD